MRKEPVGKKTTQSLRNGVVGGAVTSGLLLLVCGVVGHAADEPKAITPEQVTFFESKIRPLLANHCYACHAGSESRGNLKLDSREAILKGNAHGPALILGDPEKSALLKVVHYDGPIKMPPTGKLRPEEIAALSAWIKMGAPWPTAKGVPTGTNPGQAPDLILTPAQKSFWSFRPIVKREPPKVKNSAWCLSPIDRFILAKLEEKGLKPAPSADRPTLIRRAYFDLIGLPPTPDQVDAFVADKSPDAWAKVVDSLLANPHYGERWGRHWLDVVRYADSNGLDENVAFANAFRYRDYVVNAFNKDTPYNQFLTEQLAGDLMPPADPATQNERLTATGFLSLGAKVLAEPDKEKMVMDIVDEQIEVTSKAFMGLTVACARCHNHKFDPIPTKDYYALAGIFKSTKTMSSLNTVAMWQERPLVTAQAQAEMEAHARKIKEAEAALNAVKGKANETLLADYRKDGGKYLQAAWELSQQAEPISVAETPVKPGDPARIEIPATKFNRGNVHPDNDTFGKGIGVIINVGLPDVAEYDVEVPAAGAYQVELRYASAEVRPVHLLLNGKLIKENAANKNTGSFFPEGQKWEVQGIYAFKQGKNVFKIESPTYIPHFNKILIVPVKPRPDGVPIRTAEQIAAQYGLNVALVRHSVRFLGDVKSDPSKLSPADLQAAIGKFSARITAPEKPEEFYSNNLKQQVAAAEKTFQALKANETKPPMVMAVEEGKVENARVHVRGDTENLGDSVPRHFLAVLDGDKIVAKEGQSGRLELAQWLTIPNNPLTSRVEVNRIWQGHFGVGIVKTSENFGLLGSGATHPELLDWLARTFTEQGWSVKKMHRLILLSNTYKMSSVADPKTTALADKVDTENTLLWKMPRRRLEAEPFRDSLLAVAGDLDTTMGGTLLTTNNHDYVTNDQSGNAAQYNAHRRGIYLPIIRNALYDMFQAFDFGDPTMVNPHRANTTVAPQALYVMNSPFVLEQAKVFAALLLDQKSLSDADRVKQAYMRAYSRPANSEETERCRNFLAKYADSLTASEPDAAKRRLHAWQSLCQIILASNEFLYVN
jgi:cytochrome c553